MLHYIVSVYVGARANNLVNNILKENPNHYVDIHLDRLRRYGSSDIKRVTFVVNKSEDEERDNKVAEAARGVDIGFAMTESYVRDSNRYYSYGAWEDCVTKNIDNLDFFLIEDDYYPATNEFHRPFVNGLNTSKNVAYCCQMYQSGHAAISNGCLSVKAAKSHLDKFGESLTLKRFDDIVYPKNIIREPMTPRDRRRMNERQRQEKRRPIPRGSRVLHPGVFAQERFLLGFEELGFTFTDLMENYNHPFLREVDTVVKYGKKNGQVLLDCEFYKP